MIITEIKHRTHYNDIIDITTPFTRGHRALHLERGRCQGHEGPTPAPPLVVSSLLPLGLSTAQQFTSWTTNWYSSSNIGEAHCRKLSYMTQTGLLSWLEGRDHMRETCWWAVGRSVMTAGTARMPGWSAGHLSSLSFSILSHTDDNCKKNLST